MAPLFSPLRRAGPLLFRGAGAFACAAGRAADGGWSGASGFALRRAAPFFCLSVSFLTEILKETAMTDENSRANPASQAGAAAWAVQPGASRKGADMKAQEPVQRLPTGAKSAAFRRSAPPHGQAPGRFQNRETSLQKRKSPAPLMR
ncbi:hypothetical protein [Ottowia cancrivicina]|uniref:hypothetical protein n=1 Tax=Ottowia cancrivicina TaxID=3040346 RepID=UPI002443055E|nr:hypothetical protein [Ottowia sp. 10c7w1]